MMREEIGLSRRAVVALAGMGGAAAAVPAPAIAQPPMTGGALRDLDPIRTELVMNLVVTCSAPERPGPDAAGKDGLRSEIWPIVGGRFEGPRIRGTVIPGGGDFPVVRPDGVEVIDALYRLRTSDGVTILIHNRGLIYPERNGEWPKCRLVPEFTAPIGPHDWLNRSIFLSTLSETPRAMALAGAGENDRLIQIHRVF